nr:phospholipase A2 homolog [Parasteatoda tepidariorum]
MFFFSVRYLINRFHFHTSETFSEPSQPVSALLSNLKMGVVLAWEVLCGIVLILFQAVNATVLDLGKMMSLKTNRNPLDFVNYGNWCGLGGSGIPLDHIDRCCKMHDLCYEKIANYECYDEKPHLAHYKWKYGNGKIYCSKFIY